MEKLTDEELKKIVRKEIAKSMCPVMICIGVSLLTLALVALIIISTL